MYLSAHGSTGRALMVGVVAVVVVVLSVRSAGWDPPRTLHGLASYYGPGFHGQETASGEIFDQWEMVAAHRTLPLGTRVRVTNLENRRSVVLRVIDRGPYGRNFRRGTIIDVSKGAARHLRFLREGLIPVRVEILQLPKDRAR